MIVAVTNLTNCSDRSLLLPCRDRPTRRACFEDDTAYFRNNIVMGQNNLQTSRLACQQSCAQQAGCAYWTWDKRLHWCYLKTSSAGVTHNVPQYVSGSKRCLLPEQDAGLLVWRRSLLFIIKIIVAFCSSPYWLSLEPMVNLPTMQCDMWSRNWGVS